VKFILVAAATKGVTNVSFREKVSYTGICFRQWPTTRVSHILLLRDKLSPPREFTVVTMCVALTRDLFAIAKFLFLVY